MTDLPKCSACPKYLGELEGYLPAHCFEDVNIECKDGKKLEIFQVVQYPCTHYVHSMCLVEIWRKKLLERSKASGKQIFMFECPEKKCDKFFCFFSELEAFDCRPFILEAFNLEQAIRKQEDTNDIAGCSSDDGWSMENNTGDLENVEDTDWDALMADLTIPAPDSDDHNSEQDGQNSTKMDPTASDIGCVVWEKFFDAAKESIMPEGDSMTLAELNSIPADEIDKYLYGFVVSPLAAGSSIDTEMAIDPELDLENLFDDALAVINSDMETNVTSQREENEWLLGILDKGDEQKNSIQLQQPMDEGEGIQQQQQAADEAQPAERNERNDDSLANGKLEQKSGLTFPQDPTDNATQATVNVAIQLQAPARDSSKNDSQTNSVSSPSTPKNQQGPSFHNIYAQFYEDLSP